MLQKWYIYRFFLFFNNTILKLILLNKGLFIRTPFCRFYCFLALYYSSDDEGRPLNF